MKRISLLLCLLAFSAQSANVLIYNPVNGFSVAYLISVNTPSFEGMPNALINPVLPEGIPLQFTKVVGGLVVPMSLIESNTIVTNALAEAESNIRTNSNVQYEAKDPNGLLLRAISEVALKEINSLRFEISVAKTNLALFQARPALAPRTLSQFRNAVNNEVNSGNVDDIP